MSLNPSSPANRLLSVMSLLFAPSLSNRSERKKNFAAPSRSFDPDFVMMLANPPCAWLNSADAPVVMISISAIASRFGFWRHSRDRRRSCWRRVTRVWKSVSRAPLTFGLPSPSVSVTGGEKGMSGRTVEDRQAFDELAVEDGGRLGAATSTMSPFRLP